MPVTFEVQDSSDFLELGRVYSSLFIQVPFDTSMPEHEETNPTGLIARRLLAKLKCRQILGVVSDWVIQGSLQDYNDMIVKGDIFQ